MTLLCPVRGCGLGLVAAARSYACPAGHSFDRAKSGYVNLLLPQDKKSTDPGDRRESVEARRRSAERGLTRELLALLTRELDPFLRGSGALLDVGCGDGFVLANLAEHFGGEAWGVDISREAIDFAARRHPTLQWLIANADRRLPFADHSFRAILSITGPKNAPELRRLLDPEGVLIVAVSAPDDQAELREAVLGAAHEVDRAPRMQEIFGADFELAHTGEARQRAQLDKDALRDLLDGSYRGARHAARQRFKAQGALAVTLSHQVLVFRPRA